MNAGKVRPDNSLPLPETDAKGSNTGGLSGVSRPFPNLSLVTQDFSFSFFFYFSTRRNLKRSLSLRYRLEIDFDEKIIVKGNCFFCTVFFNKVFSAYN